eukprot:gene9702-20164_t
MDTEVQDEHHRLLRALHDSISRESELLRHLRRMKESVVAAGLKLQVAVKVVHDDEITMRTLRKEALESKKECIVAQKRADTAVELVQALRLEVSSLKRQLRTIKEQAGVPAESEMAASNNSPLRRADAEVDAMMSRCNDGPWERTNMSRGASSQSQGRLMSSQGSRSQTPLKKSIYTPFQEWKIQRYLWTPDTPAASEFQDSEAVESLVAVAMRQTGGSVQSDRLSRIRRSIKSTAAKTKQPLNNNNYNNNTNREMDIASAFDIDTSTTTSGMRPAANNPLNTTFPFKSATALKNSSTLPTIQRTMVAMEKLMKVDAEMSRFLDLGTENSKGASASRKLRAKSPSPNISREGGELRGSVHTHSSSASSVVTAAAVTASEMEAARRVLII